MDTVITMAFAAVVTQVCGLLALRMRLRAQLAQSRARHRYVAALVKALPAGSRLDECGPDGTRFTLASRPLADRPPDDQQEERRP